MTPEAAIIFLDEAARYFENRPTGGEDMAHWSNVTNATTCRGIAALIANPYPTEGQDTPLPDLY